MSLFDPNRGQNQPRSNFKSRIIFALVIAAIGWFMYMSQVEKNPVTGERQHVAISPDQEIRLGLESAPQMSREMGGELPDSDPRTQEVQRIGAKIVSQTVAGKSPWQFQFHLLADDKTVNAFALPGGQIFITRGLLDRLQTEAQLAGVLSHEVGHVIERHSSEQMAHSQLGQWLIMAAGNAVGDSSQQGGGNYSATVIASVVNQMFQLRYSRQDELEADTWGLKLMEQIGYDPRAMVQVMEILKAASEGGASMEMFQTHPNPDLRIQQINEYLAKHPPAANLSEGRPLKEVIGSAKSRSWLDFD